MKICLNFLKNLKMKKLINFYMFGDVVSKDPNYLKIKIDKVPNYLKKELRKHNYTIIKDPTGTSPFKLIVS